MPIAHALLTDQTPTPWRRGRDHLARADRYWLTTVRPDGAPHVAPVLAVWAGGGLHFSTGPATRKGGNLTADDRCAISTSDDEVDLVVEGAARRVTAPTVLRRVAEAYAEQYDWKVEIRDGAFHAGGAPTAGPPPFHVFAVDPTVAFAFPVGGTFTATRWTFSAGRRPRDAAAARPR